MFWLDSNEVFVYRSDTYVLSARIENRYCSHKIILHAIFPRARELQTMNTQNKIKMKWNKKWTEQKET